ncbi:MAG: mechanosensitive ion channel family protein [Bacillota bacterium]
MGKEAVQLLGDIKSIAGYVVFNTDWVKLVLSAVFISLSLILRQVFAKLIFKFLNKSSSNSKTNLIIYLVKVIESPARFLIIAIGVWSAALIIDFPQEYQVLLNRIFRTMIVFSVFRAAYKASDLLTIMVEKISRRNEVKFDDMLMVFIQKCTKVLIVVLGTVTIIQEWYDNIGGLLAGLGLGGLAFALAARDTVANLFGSVTIMMDRPFKIGDWVSTPNADGIIEEIGFRSTRVRTFSQALITIPNSTMSNDSITNWSKMGKRRISFYLGLKYSTTTEQIREFTGYFREVLKNHPEVHHDTIVVSFEKFGDSSLEIFFYFFTRTTDWQRYLEIRQDINLIIMDKLSEMGLEVAFPSKSVYIEKDERRVYTKDEYC